MIDYKFIYYCPDCNKILFKSNQHLTNGEVQCLRCKIEEGEQPPMIEFKDLVIKVIPIDKDEKKGLE